jgi:molybdopterin-binding protein
MSHLSSNNRWTIASSLSAMLITLLIIACQPDDNIFFKELPQIIALNAPSVFLQEQNLPVTLDVEARAVAGLSSLKVLKNNESYATKTYADELLATYAFSYIVEPTLPDGTIVTFTFIVTDKQGRESKPFILKVKAGPPYEITDAVVHGTAVKRVKGRINRDVTFSAATKYWLDSTVSVEANKTLTIQAGSTVYMKTFDNATHSRLVITQGSKIMAIGTKDLPIVFTSDKVLSGNAAESDWGGIYLYGQATTNQAAIVLEDGFKYGGSNLTDNSGTLKYVRNEYAGKNGVDAFMLLGLGEGTQLDYIQVYRCRDQAFRFKGGRASIKHLVISGHSGYGFWAEHGWRGRGQFWVFETDVAATISPVNFHNQARSLEMRNDPNNFNLQPATYAWISNVTMIGNGNTLADGTRRGLRVRLGAMAQMHNIIATNFPDAGVRAEDVESSKLADGTMLIADVRSFSNRKDFDELAETYFLPKPEFNLTTTPVAGINLGNYVGSVSSAFDPRLAPGFGTWFDSAPFIGAIKDVANDWTADGSWCKNLNGTIR